MFFSSWSHLSLSSLIFVSFLATTHREILNEMADNIKVLVDKEMEAIRQKSKLPITMLVGLE